MLVNNVYLYQTLCYLIIEIMIRYTTYFEQMDKSWILEDRDSLEYEIGVEKFLMYAEKTVKILRKYLVHVHVASISKNYLLK